MGVAAIFAPDSARWAMSLPAPTIFPSSPSPGFGAPSTGVVPAGKGSVLPPVSGASGLPPTADLSSPIRAPAGIGLPSGWV